jgi:hypothetical protein
MAAAAVPPATLVVFLHERQEAPEVPVLPRADREVEARRKRVSMSVCHGSLLVDVLSSIEDISISRRCQISQPMD